MYCDDVSCAFGQICCFNPVDVGDHCGLSGQCEAGYVEFTCNGPGDCPGEICCASLDLQTQKSTGISCQATCDQANEIVVCDLGNPQCPGGTTCQDSGSLQFGPGYMVCR